MRHVFQNVRKCWVAKEGFSLLEVSITLAILGVLAASSFSLYTDKKRISALSITRDRQEIIFKSLANYAIRYGKLPCPAKDLEGISPKNCSQTQGYIPFATLGLLAKSAQDGQGKPLTYEIAPKLAGEITPHTSFHSQTDNDNLSINGDALKQFCNIKEGLTAFKGKVHSLTLSEQDPIAVALYSDVSKNEPSWRTRDNLLLQYAHFSCAGFLANYALHRSSNDPSSPFYQLLLTSLQ